MKHSHIAGMVLLTGLLSGCSDNGPLQDTNSRQEEYVRQFIEDFGLPVPGHDFSMATSAGLQVKASKPMSLIVTAEIDGKEYEFADLTVPAGTTPLPVTIPKSVSQLNIYLGLAKYTVGVNETVDLDRLAKSPASRGYEFDGTQMSFSTNATGRPVIAFKYGDFLDAYFTANPIGNENTESEVNDENGNKVVSICDWFTEDLNKLLYCETNLCDYPMYGFDTEYVEYDIFPVYWSTSKYGKDYSLRLSYWDNATNDKDKMAYMDFGKVNSENPFPGLKYSTSVSTVNEDVFTNLSGFTASGTDGKAYTIGNKDMVIVSEGVRVRIQKKDTGEGLSIELVTNHNGTELVSSSNPLNNKYLWGNAYYNTSISNLATSRGAAKRTFLDKSILGNAKGGKDRKSPDRCFEPLTVKNPDGTVDSRKGGVMPFLLGFSSPATEAGEDMVRDYANALFLVVPVTKRVDDNMDEYYYLSLGEWYRIGFYKYYWTIAAEDLGGSCDWDFNDAVFTFTDQVKNLNTENVRKEKTKLWGPEDAVTVRSIEVLPMAAGGTLPLYITYTGKIYDTTNSLLALPAEGSDDYNTINGDLKAAKEDTEVLEGTWILGTEIHKWLGRGTYTSQFNTGAQRVHLTTEDKIVRFNIPTNLTLNQYLVPGSYISQPNYPLMGFSVLVDKENNLEIDTKKDGKYSFQAMPDLQLGEGTYLIGRPNPDENQIAPQMILVQSAVYNPAILNPSGIYTNEEPDWMALEWEWPREFISIADAYPDFAKWLTEDASIDWTKNKNTEKVTKR